MGSAVLKLVSAGMKKNVFQNAVTGDGLSIRVI